MYVPNKFVAPNIEVVEAYIKKNSFATLVSIDTSQNLVASHIPLLLQEKEGKKILSGHLSKANKQGLTFDGTKDMLAIFMQTHAYISSSWYDHINVPTWNYIAVHIYGKVTEISGKDLYHSMDDLVEKYETGRTPRFHLDQFNPKELKAHLNGVTGFYMSIDRIEAAYKLSQNRDDKNFAEIIRQLELSGDQLNVHIAAEMKKLR